MVKFHKAIDIEYIGLDESFFQDYDSLLLIASHIEEIVKEELEKILGQRTNKYYLVVGVENNNGYITVSIDLEVEAYILPKIDLGNIVDKVIRNAFDRIRIFLSRYRKS